MLLLVVFELWFFRHGFGDCRKPLAETAALIEDIVYRQMVDIVSDLCIFHTANLWSLYRLTRVSRHPSWNTGGFCWGKVLLLTCPCCDN